MATDKRPNILLVMPDQMRGDCLSLESHPVLETPNIDEIGKAGVYFRRAYTTCASCVPARRSLLTGLFPSSSGVAGASKGREIHEETLPQALEKNGYFTALAGRYMHQFPYEADYGFNRRILGSTYVSGDEYADMLSKEAPGVTDIKDFIRGLGLSCNGWEAESWPYDESLHPTNWVVRRTRELLADHRGEQPVFITASFYAPHPPLFPPEKYFKGFLDKNLPPPAVGEWEGSPPQDDWDKGEVPHRVYLRGEVLRRAQAGYFGLIKHIDDQIRPLIREFRLKSENMGRHWMIVFTSDHGELLGDHYLFRKCEPYEGASRIPFLIQGSDEMGFKSGTVSESPVCLEDIMPTLLEAAGADMPSGRDGKSLMPVLTGSSSRVRSILHGEHAPSYDQLQAYHFLTDGRMKYIWRPLDGSEQLFDLLKDRNETRDLSDSPEYRGITSEWRKKLISSLTGRSEGFTDGKSLFPGRK